MKGFDLLAPIYPSLEHLVFGSALDRARRLSLDFLPDRTTIWLIGEGNGRFLRELLEFRRNAEVTVVEASRGMISQAQRLCASEPGASGVSYRCQDFLQLEVSEPSTDVVITHFFLDLFNLATQRLLVRKLARLTRTGGRWINVEFRSNQTRSQRAWLWLAYRFFRLTCRIEAARLYDLPSSPAPDVWELLGEQHFSIPGIVAQSFQRTQFAC